MTSGCGIAEWFGLPFDSLSPEHRQELARAALKLVPDMPGCPFQSGEPCTKTGGVCSMKLGQAAPFIVCPRRFQERDLLLVWLAGIVGFSEVHVAAEVPFMYSPDTKREAGRIDLVIAKDGDATSWVGLEIQAVYFSGKGMRSDFEMLLGNADETSPPPTRHRRPDWRSSSAKRLMPQLQVKVPTLRRWGTKLAVAVDLPFFEAIGGASESPSHDLNDGDIVWLVPRINADYQLVEHHWEVLSLEASSDKLLSAETLKRQEFETALRTKLRLIQLPGEKPV